MFARWCQENFFKYAMKYFGLDMIISYFFKDINDTDELVNPARRALEKQIKSKNTKLKHLEAKFGNLHYNSELNERQFAGFNSKKAQLQEDISIYKIFQSDSSFCIDDTSICTKNWNGILSSGGLLENGVYRIKLHIKDPAGNEFYDYLSPYVINIDTSL